MKRLKLWLIPMMIGMMLITAFVYPMDKEVMIETDGDTITVMTRAHTVKQLLEEVEHHHCRIRSRHTRSRGLNRRPDAGQHP
jgi:uncharacterized protein YabE (DUF348 family)